jgi:BMFP domain-containing protein YqiC
MVMVWQKNRLKLKELEQRIAELEEKYRREKNEGMAIPADIVSEWLNGKKEA